VARVDGVRDGRHGERVEQHGGRAEEGVHGRVRVRAGRSALSGERKALHSVGVRVRRGIVPR
jgi:hypothetical protein